MGSHSSLLSRMCSPRSSLTPLPLPRGISVGSWTGGPVLQWQRPVAGLAIPAPRNVDAWVAAAEPSTKCPRLAGACTSSVARPQKVPKDKIVENFVLDDAGSAAREAAAAGVRPRLLAELAAMVAECSPVPALVLRMRMEGEPCVGTSPSLSAVFHRKATGTIAKRSSALRLYLKWLKSIGINHLVISEDLVFKYFMALRGEGAPASRAQALREAVGFLVGTVEVEAQAVLASRRLQGSSLQMLSTRRALRQRAPLLVSALACLEEIVCSSSDPRERVLVGALVFTALSRSRVGDLCQVEKQPSLDLKGDGTGYVECNLTGHKTARPGSKRSMAVVAVTPGVTPLQWAEAWVAARAATGADSIFSLFPAPASTGGWATSSLTTFEVAALLRSCLVRSGFRPEDLTNIGSHSLKATALSWTAKYGVPQAVRRVLGYHKAKDEASVAAYARDELAAPLRALEDVLAAIRDGSFRPDESRSGRVGLAVQEKQPVVELSDEEVSSISSSSQAVTSPVPSDDDGEVGTVAEVPLGKYVLNKKSSILHLLGADGRLDCGRRLPLEHQRVSGRPSGSRLCSRCF